MNTDPFKICPLCGTVWNTMDEFLSDPSLELSGYQVHFAELEKGLFYFSHITEQCGTTLSVPVQAFTELSDLPFLHRGKRRPEGCPGFCLRKKELTPCPEECECAWVRNVMQAIREWKIPAN